ncbi:MAG: DUF2628 domain-containing protein [Cytophagaceae bacterium]
MEITEEYLRAYFGKKSDYYLDKWNEYKNGKIISFKPYAFLFGLFWLLHRKMYKIALIVALVILVEGIIEDYLLTDIINIEEDYGKIIDLFTMFTFGAFFGMFGNYLYMKSSEQKIKRILSEELTKEETILKLEKSGGTSWAFLIILCLIIATFIVVNNFIE